MSYTLLPTPQKAELSTELSTCVGPRSPLSAAGEIPAELVDEMRKHCCGEGTTPVEMVLDKSMGKEAYRISISDEKVTIAASHTTGWRYAIQQIRQLAPRGRLPLGTIDDCPALDIRGYHLNFNISMLDYERGKAILDSMSRWRLNTVMFEYDRRYPYRKYRDVPTPDALKREEVAALVKYAASLDIESIPLQQSLGHMEFVLKNDAYSCIREEDEHRDQLCPLNPKSFDLFREMADDFVELHSGIRYFHIGGDETRRLGVCPSCAKVAEAEGKGRLYVDYMRKAVEYICSLGLTPIIWDDMLCKYPNVIAEMPRELVIMYWDYWTTQNPSALFVARPAGYGVVADNMWRDNLNKTTETEASTIRHFVRHLDFKSELNADFMERFGPYLGDEFPQKIRAFPYLEYYQDLGFKVIGAPTGSGNTSTWHKLPDYPRFGDNIRAFSRRIDEAGALGLVTTAWYSVPPEALMPAITYTGQFTWNTRLD